MTQSRRRLAALLLPALALGCAASPGTTGYRPFLELCGDPARPPGQAAQVCARALAAGGLSPEAEAGAAVNLGAALLDLGRPARAEAAYSRALSTGARAALAHEGRAKAREALGRLDEAAADWDRAAALAPSDPVTLTGRSAFRLRRGDAAGALADAEAGLARAPASVDLRVNRALALAALGREAEAEAALSAALRDAPEDARLRATRARLRAGRDPAGAVADYDRAIAARPDWAEAWFERGRLLDRLGRRGQAEEDFRRAWELGLRDPELAERVATMSR